MYPMSLGEIGLILQPNGPETSDVFCPFVLLLSKFWPRFFIPPFVRRACRGSIHSRTPKVGSSLDSPFVARSRSSSIGPSPALRTSMRKSMRETLRADDENALSQGESPPNDDQHARCLRRSKFSGAMLLMSLPRGLNMRKRGAPSASRSTMASRVNSPAWIVDFN